MSFRIISGPSNIKFRYIRSTLISVRSQTFTKSHSTIREFIFHYVLAGTTHMCIGKWLNSSLSVFLWKALSIYILYMRYFQYWSCRSVQFCKDLLGDHSRWSQEMLIWRHRKCLLTFKTHHHVYSLVLYIETTRYDKTSKQGRFKAIPAII